MKTEQLKTRSEPETDSVQGKRVAAKLLSGLLQLCSPVLILQ
jgi:hypothetical protein